MPVTLVMMPPQNDKTREWAKRGRRRLPRARNHRRRDHARAPSRRSSMAEAAFGTIPPELLAARRRCAGCRRRRRRRRPATTIPS